jgi:hypothetical protein
MRSPWSRRVGRHCSPQRKRRPLSQTWRTFLTNHVATLVSIDFFTVSTVTGRVLFVFVVLPQWTAPWMRGAPQSGFAVAILLTSSRMAASVSGPPGRT